MERCLSPGFLPATAGLKEGKKPQDKRPRQIQILFDVQIGPIGREFVQIKLQSGAPAAGRN